MSKKAKAKSKPAPKPQIKFYATEWSLAGYPRPTKPWTPLQRVQRIAAAGFDGIATGGGNAEVVDAARELGLELVGGVDIGSAKEARSKLQRFADSGIVHVNVQLADHDTSTKQSVKLARRVMSVGNKLGLEPAIEVHRDTCTETPEKVLALADGYQKKTGNALRMNFDHSHPAIIKQLRPAEYWSRLNEREDLWQASRLIHFRPFTGSHCQVPVTRDGKRLGADFLLWKEHYLVPALTSWLAGAKGGEVLHVVPELGPKGSGYALECFPDIWIDAIRLRDEIRKVWRSLIRGWKP